MCNSIPNAQSRTHATLTATLVLEQGAPSIINIVVGTTTRSASMTPTATSIPGDSGTSTKTSTLTESQIIGIAVAGVGGSALAIGAMLLFACYRRRRANRLPEQDSIHASKFGTPRSSGIGSPPNSGKMIGKQEISRPVFNEPILGPGGPASGYASRAAPRVPARPKSLGLGLNPFSRRSITPDFIGLAISEEDRHAEPSPLLPEKPVLHLQVPGGSASNTKATMAHKSASLDSAGAYSTATTAVGAEELWAHEKAVEIGSSTHLQAPAAATLKKIKGGEFDPAEYSAEGKLVEPDFYVRPLNLSRNFSQPHHLDVGGLHPPGKTMGSLKNPRLTTTSSIYSQRYRRSALDREASVANNNRQTNIRNPKQYSTMGPYDPKHASIDSMTSFDSSSSFEEISELPADEPALLSPVVESPNTEAKSPQQGTSPVTYPRIHGRLSYTSMARPPPPQPNFTKPWLKDEVSGPRGPSKGHTRNASSTSNADYPPFSSTISSPDYIPGSHSHNASLSISPETPHPQPALNMASSAPNTTGSTANPSTNPNLNTNTNKIQIATPPPPPSSSSSSQKPTLTPLKPFPSSFSANSPPKSSGTSPPFSKFNSSTSPASATLLAKTPDTPSTILSKRLAKNAALAASASSNGSSPPNTYTLKKNLTVKTPTSSSGTKPRGDHFGNQLTSEKERERDGKNWRVLDESAKQEAKSPTWRPRTGSKGSIWSAGPKRKESQDSGYSGRSELEGDEGWRGRGEERETQESYDSIRRQELNGMLSPDGTPGWLPKLTPTRRGNDLFLSVA